MPAKAAARSPHLALVSGEDDLSVAQRGRAIYNQWVEELGGMDHEILDGSAGNVEEALRGIGRLREALNTLPFFGGGKAVWFKNCTFLGDDRTAGSTRVTEALSELANELKTFPWGSVRLLITAVKVDKRKSFYKAIQKTGSVEEFGGWSVNDRDWAQKAETLLLQILQDAGHAIDDTALSLMVQFIGPSPRQLTVEAEKVSLYVGPGQPIHDEDVEAVCVRNKQARAFALAEAVGNRNLPEALKLLDEELWSMQFDRKKSEIGMLYGLIGKIRTLLMARELVQGKWLRPSRSYPQFKSQLEQVQIPGLPEDKKLNPLSIHPYVLFQAVGQCNRYTSVELVQAMEKLLECNRKLVSSSQEERMVLQQTLVEILTCEPEVVFSAGSPSD